MKEKEKILRIRPFNMANNSAGGVFLAQGVILSYIFTLPAIMIIGTGMAEDAGDGKLDYQNLNRKLERFLTKCLVFFCIALFASLYLVLFEGMDLSFVPIFLLIGAFPIGMHVSMSSSAATLNGKGKLFAGKWLLFSIINMLLIGAVIVSLLFMLFLIF
ncbi:MAG: hypothetical protein FWH52_05725 [Synergistaceae bacterium]|nr:hypothetical protein [Synergistaceae bacterium]